MTIDMIINCYFCKNELTRTESKLKKKNPKQFCDRECYRQFQLSNKNPSRNRTIIECKQCRNKKELPAYYKSKYGTKFCSLRCYHEYFRVHGLFKSNGLKRVNRIKMICQYCKQEILTHPYRKETQVFCSHKCKTENGRKKLQCPSCRAEFIVQQHQLRKYCSDKCFIIGCDKRNTRFYNEIICDLKPYYNIKYNTILTLINRRIHPDLLIGKIIIECDGAYWHCDPDIYDSAYFHTKIKKYAHEIWAYDQKRDADCNACGYTVIRIKELDYKKNKTKIINDLRRQIDEILQNKKNNDRNE